MRFPGGRGGKGHGGFLAGGEFEDHRRSASRVPTRIARHHSSFTFAARPTSPHFLVSVSINCANSAAVLPTVGVAMALNFSFSGRWHTKLSDARRRHVGISSRSKPLNIFCISPHWAGSESHVLATHAPPRGAAIDWPPPACASGFVSGGFEYQPRDDLRMGDHRQMAGLHLDGLRTHPLGHEVLEIGIDRAVLGRNRIEARFRSPRGCVVLPVSRAFWNGSWTA